MSEDVKSTLEIIALILGFIATAAGGLAVCRRLFSWYYSVWRSVHSLHRGLGSKPFGEFSRRIDQLESSHSEIAIRLRVIEEQAGIGAFVCDEAGNLIYANDWMCEKFGLDSREIAGHGWSSAVHPNDVITVVEAWQYVVDHNLPITIEYRVVPQNGLPCWVAVGTVALSEDKSGYRVGYVKDKGVACECDGFCNNHKMNTD